MVASLPALLWKNPPAEEANDLGDPGEFGTPDFERMTSLISDTDLFVLIQEP